MIFIFFIAIASLGVLFPYHCVDRSRNKLSLFMLLLTNPIRAVSCPCLFGLLGLWLTVSYWWQIIIVISSERRSSGYQYYYLFFRVSVCCLLFVTRYYCISIFIENRRRMSHYGPMIYVSVSSYRVISSRLLWWWWLLYCRHLFWFCQCVRYGCDNSHTHALCMCRADTPHKRINADTIYDIKMFTLL